MTARAQRVLRRCDMLLNDVLEFVGATLDRLSPTRAQELARRLAASGDGREQVGRLAQELVDWSQRNGERVRDLVQREVTAQLASAGVATKADVDALETRIRRLERAASAAERTRRKATDAKATAGESTSKRPSARPSAAPPPERRTGTAAGGAAGKKAASSRAATSRREGAAPPAPPSPSRRPTEPGSTPETEA
jgi:polyhydroxyalkanoate synthesis regulator phasin